MFDFQWCVWFNVFASVNVYCHDLKARQIDRNNNYETIGSLFDPNIIAFDGSRSDPSLPLLNNNPNDNSYFPNGFTVQPDANPVYADMINKYNRMSSFDLNDPAYMFGSNMNAIDFLNKVPFQQPFNPYQYSNINPISTNTDVAKPPTTFKPVDHSMSQSLFIQTQGQTDKPADSQPSQMQQILQLMQTQSQMQSPMNATTNSTMNNQQLQLIELLSQIKQGQNQTINDQIIRNNDNSNNKSAQLDSQARMQNNQKIKDFLQMFADSNKTASSINSNQQLLNFNDISKNMFATGGSKLESLANSINLPKVNTNSESICSSNDSDCSKSGYV
jgi:hypothetical protein